MRRPHPAWLVPFALPLYWRISVGPGALGRRTSDLVSHVWAIWNGGGGDPTRTDHFSFPEGLDLLPIFGGWLHTLLGVGLHRLGADPLGAYSTVVCAWLVVAGLAGMALARVLGTGMGAAIVGGLLLQLDGFVLYHATDGRPEHAGLGFTALALTAALSLWQRSGSLATARTAAAGALVFLVSWEHALWLALACAWLLPWLHTTPAGRTGRRRWLHAGLLAAVLACPWIWMFFDRALAVRSVDEGHETLLLSVDQSLTLIPWLLSAGRHPGRGLFLLVLALPWLVRRTHRTLAFGVVAGLLISFVLALGPSPGLYASGDLWPAPGNRFILWGPFTWMQKLPVVGWFHAPDRLAMGVSIAIAGAGALLVERLWTWRKPAAIVAAIVLPGWAAIEAHTASDWPRAGFALPEHHPATTLAQSPVPGAVLDLPPATAPWQQEARVVHQLIHHRPIPGHLFLDRLATDRTEAIVQAIPLLRWVARGDGRAAPELSDAHRAQMIEQGFGILTIHSRQMTPRRRKAVLHAMAVEFGAPLAEDPGVWTAYGLAPDG